MAMGQPDHEQLRLSTLAVAERDSLTNMVLLLLEMQANHALKLPYRAAEQQPESVRLRLTARQSLPLLEQKKESNDSLESATH